MIRQVYVVQCAALLLLQTMAAPAQVPAFQVISTSEQISERGQVERCLVRGVANFSFNPPAKWRRASDAAAGRIEFSGLNGEAILSVGLKEVSSQTSAKAAVEKALQENMAEGPLPQVEPAFAGDLPGTMAEKHFNAANGEPYIIRKAVFEKGGALVILTLSCPERLLAKCHPAWTGLLNSLRF